MRVEDLSTYEIIEKRQIPEDVYKRQLSNTTKL